MFHMVLCVSVCTHMRMYTYIGQRPTSLVFLYISLFYFDRDSLTEPGTHGMNKSLKHFFKKFHKHVGLFAIKCFCFKGKKRKNCNFIVNSSSLVLSNT